MQDFLIKALEEQDTLCHHGILGQKWGVRRYQNSDGSLTDAGRKRYTKLQNKADKRAKFTKYYDKKAKELEATQPSYILNSTATLDGQNYNQYKDNVESGIKAYENVAKKMRQMGQSPQIDSEFESIRSKFYSEQNPSKMTQKETERKRTEDAFKTNGWTVDNSGDFGSDIYATKSGKLGDHKISIVTVVDPGDVAGYAKEEASGCNKAINKLQKNGSNIMEQCKDIITAQIYDENRGDIKNAMSRQEFAKSIKPEMAYVSGTDSYSNTATISFTSSNANGQTFDITWDLDKNKPVIKGITTSSGFTQNKE